MRARKRVELGESIVSDPEICGGELTFKGTRVLVRDVLHMLEDGWDWARISAAWDGRVGREAIAEALGLAREALIEKAEKRAEKRRRAA